MTTQYQTNGITNQGLNKIKDSAGLPDGQTKNLLIDSSTGTAVAARGEIITEQPRFNSTNNNAVNNETTSEDFCCNSCVEATIQGCCQCCTECMQSSAFPFCCFICCLADSN